MCLVYWSLIIQHIFFHAPQFPDFLFIYFVCLFYLSLFSTKANHRDYMDYKFPCKPYPSSILDMMLLHTVFTRFIEPICVCKEFVNKWAPCWATFHHSARAILNYYLSVSVMEKKVICKDKVTMKVRVLTYRVKTVSYVRQERNMCKLLSICWQSMCSIKKNAGEIAAQA